MKKLLLISVLAVSVFALSPQESSAWLSWKFFCGVHGPNSSSDSVWPFFTRTCQVKRYDSADGLLHGRWQIDENWQYFPRAPREDSGIYRVSNVHRGFGNSSPDSFRSQDGEESKIAFRQWYKERGFANDPPAAAGRIHVPSVPAADQPQLPAPF